jgi:PIN domain nuclease of toxin-antitoxin system
LLPRYLLDTHALIRWLIDPKKLSREQLRVLERVVRRGEPVALSAISLLEIAVLASEGKVKVAVGDFLAALETNPMFRILALTCEIASEVASLRILRDPADRAIVATARVHRLALITSDERIVESHLVPVVT